MNEFISGLTTMGFAVAGLFFLRFCTQDIFFGLFAGAFWLFALNTAIIALFGVEENHIFAYLLRLIGFSAANASC
jgi:hypothetical protein